MRLASPEGFAEDPELVMDWYAARRIQMASARPNAGHLALASRPDIVQITQNTDDLLRRAGCEHLIQLHGDITADRCHGNCGHVEQVDMSDPPGNRSCPVCSSWGMRPTVTWFGESLPSAAWEQAEQTAIKCDLMLVVGTSAVVYPAAALIELASRWRRHHRRQFGDHRCHTPGGTRTAWFGGGYPAEAPSIPVEIRTVLAGQRSR